MGASGAPAATVVITVLLITRRRSRDVPLVALAGVEVQQADECADGIAERRRVCLAWEGEILGDVPVNLVPYAVGVVLVNQHRLTGISMHDKLKQVQDKHTMFDRALGDNIIYHNQGCINGDRIIIRFPSFLIHPLCNPIFIS